MATNHLKEQNSAASSLTERFGRLVLNGTSYVVKDVGTVSPWDQHISNCSLEISPCVIQSVRVASHLIHLNSQKSLLDITTRGAYLENAGDQSRKQAGSNYVLEMKLECNVPNNIHRTTLLPGEFTIVPLRVLLNASISISEQWCRYSYCTSLGAYDVPSLIICLKLSNT